MQAVPPFAVSTGVVASLYVFPWHTAGLRAIWRIGRLDQLCATPRTCSVLGIRLHDLLAESAFNGGCRAWAGAAGSKATEG